MPITGQGWELHIQRRTTQVRASDGKVRTVGDYRVYHGGAAQNALMRNGIEVAKLFGTTAESRGPSDNSVAKNGKRIEAGRYPLWTQDGTKYDTIGYVQNESTGAMPKPGLELKDTGARSEILIHPGVNGFLSSIGCINLCTVLPDQAELISYSGSRRRVIALIEDLKNHLGAAFPTQNSRLIPGAWVVVDEAA